MLEVVLFNSRSVLIKGVENPALHEAILRNHFNSSVDVVPSFHEILIVFKEEVSDLKQVEKEIGSLMSSTVQKKSSALLNIPICFDESFGLDQKRIEEHTGYSKEEIIHEICKTRFNVAFLGFLPGFAYMNGLPEKYRIPRLQSPRNSVKKGSFAIAENQVGIYPNASPAGWNIIGNCPVMIFDMESEELTLFKAGDKLQFYEISKSEHEKMQGKSLSRKMFLG